MIGWHTEKAARICRERTGGAGYLWVNQVGDAIQGAHSAVTAEGDNKVLMQKVTKDILTDLRKKRHNAVKFSKERIAQLKSLDSLSLEDMRDLIYLREVVEIKNIAKRLQHLVLEKEKKFFDVWMAEVNDEI